jgi:hypothetical protein
MKSDFLARYNLPKNNTEAVRYLSNILNIPLHLAQGDASKISLAMAGTIMYRQLDRQSRQQAMLSIHQLEHNQLKSSLISKCTDALINPQWAEWSLTNEELAELLKFHNQFNRWSSIVGANPGLYGTAGSAWMIIKNGASSENLATLIASIALVGVHELSHYETHKYSNELERRIQ